MIFLTLGSFFFFTGLVGFLTWRMTRKDTHNTSSGYFLAGRSLTGGFIAGSLMLTNLSTEQLVGLNGAAFTDGICVMAWEVIAGTSLVVLALLYLPKYLKSGIATVPQFLEERFNSGTRTITSIIFIIAYAGILLPIILYTGATALAGILDLQALTGIQSNTAILWVNVWLIGIIGSLYAIFGGLRTVAISDTINGIGLLVGGILITVLGLYAVNDGGIFAAWSELKEANPEKFNSIGGSNQSVPFSTLFTGVLLLNLFYWTTNQQIIQRTFGAKNLAEAQKGVLFAGWLKVLAPIILVFPGIIAFHLYASDGLAADQSYGTLVRNVLPAPLAGFFAAVMVGAILSSFNSALNSTATLFSLGVYQHMIKPGAPDLQVIKSGKMFGVIIAVISMIVAPLLAGQDSIFGYLQKMNGLYFIPIFSVVLMGMWNRNVRAEVANSALIVGFVIIAAGYFLFPNVVDAMHEFHFLGVVFAFLVFLMLICGKVEPRDTPWEHAYSGDVDLTPWKYAKPVGFSLVATVLVLYLAFADFSILTKV
ncbi:MAG TPA: solute:sodium symporter family transporter [Verrucomicrobiales bacterium]|nr:solute:sodium symporter family transporter [Verrucomicrobiales bacterium]HIL68251.1 solute:sodium symporter family transporter [Verrucomicrobiota bacterium]